MKDEFDFIHYIKKSFGLRAIGDDCAVLPKSDDSDLLVTADLMVEDIDFHLDRTRPEDLGHKALAISLSDIAAMGGEPVWAMLTVGIPEKLWETDFAKRFYEGWNELAAHFGVELVGGDISRSPERFLVDSIVGGEVPREKAVLRSGAKAGDGIYVSGSLGGAAGGLRMLEKGGAAGVDNSRLQNLIERQLRPMPRTELGRAIRESGLASSMIDLSDGLSSDIHHICEQSGVGAELDASLLPVDVNLAGQFGPDETLALVLNGGEDFELLFTVPEEKTASITGLEVTRIGTATGSARVVELLDGDRRVLLQPSGYRHF